jgi:hypothetical protein
VKPSRTGAPPPNAFETSRNSTAGGESGRALIEESYARRLDADG